MSEASGANGNAVAEITTPEIRTLDSDLNIIQTLDDEPNDVGGLSSAELKAKFDEAGNTIKTFINESLVPDIRTVCTDIRTELAEIGLFVFHVTRDSESGTFSADRTFAEILAAYEAGDLVLLHWEGMEYRLDGFYEGLFCIFIRHSIAIDVDGISGMEVSAFLMGTTNVVMLLEGKQGLLREGGIMTGALTLADDPTEDLHAATKQYVDQVAANSGSALPEVTASDNGRILGVSGGAWAVVDAPEDEKELPEVTASDNGRILGVSGGAWAVMDVPEDEKELPGVTANDNGRILGVSGGAWAVMDAPEDEKELPGVTADDNGKTLMVVGGAWVAAQPEKAAPASSVDLSAYESDGVITETYADGSSVTYTFAFDSDGNPTKITDSNGNTTVLTW